MEKVIINYKMKDNDSKIEYKTIGKFNVETDFIYLEFIEKNPSIPTTQMDTTTLLPSLVRLFHPSS